MSLELAAHAESAIRSFFRRDDALEKLRALHADVIAQIETKQIKADRPADFAHSLLDVAVQRVVETLSWELLTQPDATLEAVGVPALLDMCIAGVHDKLLVNSAPYTVLEDLLDGQTLSNCEKLWALLESRKHKLTTSDFIPVAGRTTKASLCLLRLCNALLRRLSKTHNSVFCGKILVFLSFTFALSERSGVNLMGKPNIANVTAFEDEDAFESAEAIDSAAAADATTAIDNKQQLVVLDASSSSLPSGPPIDYKLYQTFWSLQRYFREHELAIQNATNWETFFDELAVVLAALEGNAFSPDDLERTRDLLQSASPSTGSFEPSTTSKEHFFQPKYLTNSRLFRLQLRDPVLREVLLTQFLILLNYLMKQKVPERATTPKAAVQSMQTRVLLLLEQTPSDSDGFRDLVVQVLERERNWTKWKVDKCPPYEKVAPAVDVVAAAPTPNQRHALRPTSAVLKRTRRVAPLDDSTSPLLEQILTESSKPSQLLEKIKGANRACTVPLATYMARFTEAWDPENGIEAAYWPDEDPMHCWRTMRMAMRASVEHLELAVNGAGAIVKGVLKIAEKEKPITAASATTNEAVEPLDVKKEVKTEEVASLASESSAAKVERAIEEEEEEPPLKRVRPSSDDRK